MRRAWLAVTSTVVGVVLVGVGVPAATAGGGSVVTDPFTEVTSTGNWVVPPGALQAVDQACLTDGTDTGATPIPGCGGTSPTAGLRLNAASPDQEGGLYYGGSVDAANGLDAVFDSTAVSGTNGPGAEGSSFFVAASDPGSDTASAVTLGPGEGHLGYSAANGATTPAAVDGLTNGYLDVGLDSAGNDASVANSGAGCTSDPDSTLPNSVVVRGPGSGTSGYCVLSESQFDGSFDSQPGTTLHVEVAINPTDSDLVDAGGFTVEPGTFEVEANPGGGSLHVVTSGSLPNASGVYADPSFVDDSGVPLAFSFGWTGSSNASSGPSDVDTISHAAVTTLTAAAPTATALGFLTEPVDAMVNATMTNPDGSPTDLRVGAQVTPGGAVDPAYTGPVTLGFGANPGKATFLVGGTPQSTVTVAAVQGVADITPIIINAVGFGYTLTATAAGLRGTTSTAFDVASSAAVCSPDQSCTVSATGAPGTGVSAVVTGARASDATVLTASFGGNVAPLHPCDSSVAGVLTFNGARQKDIRFTVATKRPILLFCYGQPKPFIDLTLHRTTFFNAVNHEYEGLLAPCIAHLVPAPCISKLALRRAAETVTVIGGSGDPRMSH